MSWGSQFQHLQSMVESFFPVHRLVDTLSTYALTSSSLTWRAGPTEQWKGHLPSLQPLRNTGYGIFFGAFPCNSAQLTEVFSTSSYKNMNYRIRMKEFGEAWCLHKQLKRGKPILGHSDSGKSFSAFQVRSWISAMKQTEELTFLKGICSGCTHFEIFPY